MVSVLVVEDETFTQQLLSHIFEAAGYRTLSAETAKDGFQIFSSTPFDLAILDLNLPDEDGLTLARQIRNSSDVPIIVLTGRSDKASRMAALEMGVDDFIEKPVDPKELILRAKNAIARANRQGSPQTRARSREFGPWQIDRAARCVVRSCGLRVSLTKSEYNLLSALAHAPNTVLDRDQLLDALGRIDQPETDRTVDVLISRLRKKLEDDPKAPAYIKTVFGMGYMLSDAPN